MLGPGRVVMAKQGCVRLVMPPACHTAALKGPDDLGMASSPLGHAAGPGKMAAALLDSAVLEQS